MIQGKPEFAPASSATASNGCGDGGIKDAGPVFTQLFVILDLEMPGINGVQTADLIRQAAQHAAPTNRGPHGVSIEAHSPRQQCRIVASSSSLRAEDAAAPRTTMPGGQQQPHHPPHHHDSPHDNMMVHGRHQHHRSPLPTFILLSSGLETQDVLEQHPNAAALCNAIHSKPLPKSQLSSYIRQFTDQISVESSY